MTIIILIAMYIILSIGIAILAVSIHELWFHNHQSRVGFIPTKLKSIIKPLDDIIQKNIGSKNQHSYHFYELGCGTGHVLRHVAKKYNFKKNIGIELNQIWLLICKILNSKNDNIKAIKTDVIEYNYMRPAVFYAYLKPSILEKVYQSGGFDKSLVILLTFAIPNIKPKETISLEGPQHRIHVYDFRSANA